MTVYDVGPFLEKNRLDGRNHERVPAVDQVPEWLEPFRPWPLGEIVCIAEGYRPDAHAADYPRSGLVAVEGCQHHDFVAQRNEGFAQSLRHPFGPTDHMRGVE